MTKIITVAVTYWRPVTEVYTLKVEDHFELENAVEASAHEAEMYETLTVEGVQVLEPERGKKQDFEYEKKAEQPLEAVTDQQIAAGEVPVRQH